MSQPNRHGGMFGDYEFDAQHIGGAPWAVTAGLLILAFPLGMFYVGALLHSSIHRRPAKPVEERNGGFMVMLKTTAIVLGVIVALVGVVVILAILFA